MCSSCSGVQLGEVCQHSINCNNDENCYINEYKADTGEKLFDLVAQPHKNVRFLTAPQECPISRRLSSANGQRVII